jgi:hypothetical protein
MKTRDWSRTRLVDALRTQLEQAWRFSQLTLNGLSDDEYFWEPVAGCWSVRRRQDAATELVWGKGDWVVENAWQPPTPPPFTTIAWRLMHGYDCLQDFVARGLHQGPKSWNEIEVAGTAADALTLLEALVRQVDLDLGGLEDEALNGKAEGEGHSAHGAVIFGIREATHHWGEAGVLRDLFRVRGTR